MFREIKSYYESQKSTNDLRAVYLISGTLKNVNGEVKKDERPECSHECRRTELVREEKLESKKSTYETVDTCEIYCLHISPIKVGYFLILLPIAVKLSSSDI